MVELPPEPSSSADARAYVAGELRGTGGEGALEPALVITAELVNNAVLHARTPFRVAVTTGDDEVRIEVVDQAVGDVRIPRRGPDAVTGRGLRLVTALADGGWGVDLLPDGKRVWAVVRVTPRRVLEDH